MMLTSDNRENSDSILELREQGGKELLAELADACAELLGDELAQMVVEVTIDYRHCNRYRHFFYFKQGKVLGTFVLGPDTAGLYREYVEMMTDSILVFVLKVPVRFLATRTVLTIISRPAAAFEIIERLLPPFEREEEEERMTGMISGPVREESDRITQVPAVAVSN